MQSNTFSMSREFLVHRFNETRSLGIGFRGTRQGRLGSYFEFILVSKVSMKNVDESVFNFSIELIDGQEVLFAPSPSWSACSKFQNDFECLDTNGKHCGWCSLLEECMESTLL
jgi:hypothetical protein